MRSHHLLAVASGLIAAGCGPTFTTPPAAPPPSPTTAKRGLEWSDCTSAEGGFRVKLPGPPRRTDEGGYVVHQVVLAETQTAYTVHVSPEAGMLGLVSPEVMLKSYQQRTIKRDFPKGEIVSTTDLRLGELLGKEFVLRVEGYDVIRRVYVTDKRVYLVTVSGTGLTPTTPHVVPFFDSFAVTEAKAK